MMRGVRMDKKEMIWLASKCFEKGWDFETLKYGDDLYGREGHADNVWKYVVEMKDIGRKAFGEKYDVVLY
jgi:hypothetical protein